MPEVKKQYSISILRDPETRMLHIVCIAGKKVSELELDFEGVETMMKTMQAFLDAERIVMSLTAS